MEAISYWNGAGVTWPDLGYPEVRDRFESSPETAKMAYDYQNYIGLYNPLGLCKFIAKAKLGPDRLSEIVNAALGWNADRHSLLETGDRLFQLKRMINVRLGVTPADDKLPLRLTTLARPSGSATGVLPDMEVMIPAYYKLREWDEKTGAPAEARLEKLGIPHPQVNK
jgi:aldehyde:ferredoxin oxidoreductase